MIVEWVGCITSRAQQLIQTIARVTVQFDQMITRVFSISITCAR